MQPRARGPCIHTPATGSELPVHILFNLLLPRHCFPDPGLDRRPICPLSHHLPSSGCALWTLTHNICHSSVRCPPHADHHLGHFLLSNPQAELQQCMSLNLIDRDNIYRLRAYASVLIPTVSLVPIFVLCTFFKFRCYLLFLYIVKKMFLLVYRRKFNLNREYLGVFPLC